MFLGYIDHFGRTTVMIKATIVVKLNFKEDICKVAHFRNSVTVAQYRKSIIEDKSYFHQISVSAMEIFRENMNMQSLTTLEKVKTIWYLH